MTPVEFKAARESIGLTQEEMAALLGLGDRSSVRRYESRGGIPGPVARLVAAMRAIPEVVTLLRTQQPPGPCVGD